MTLDKLAAEFSTWRANRKHPKTPVPKRLWEMAVEVAGKTSPGETAKACKVPLWKIKNKMGLETKASENIKFQRINPIVDTPSIELVTPRGVSIRIY